jgi:hypothetical protein
MAQISAVERAPVEIWERIILALIDFDPYKTPFFTVYCTPDNYLAFKRTCSDFRDEASNYSYKAIEKTRRSLRLVSKSWKVVADREDLGGRWIRSETQKSGVDMESWENALRIDFRDSGKTCTDWLEREKKTHLKSGVGARVQRLEILHTNTNSFRPTFSNLCAASAALPNLRSLSLNIRGPINYLRSISRCFPQLTHLTLFSNVDNLQFSDGDALQLEKLEVLFLFFRDFPDRPEAWSLPALEHIHIRPMRSPSGQDVISFLRQYGHTLKTMDLDDTTPVSSLPFKYNTRRPKTRRFPADFWTSFPHLELLRCSLKYSSFPTYPDKSSSLRFLVDTDPIEGGHDFVTSLWPWLEGDELKAFESITLFGPYLSRRNHLDDDEEIQGLVQILKTKKVKLVNPAGKLWTNSSSSLT